MAAAPQYGTMTFNGVQTGRSYAVDVYLSDVAAANVNFDSGGGAGSSSDQFWIAPENIILKDFSVKTGLTDTTKIHIVANGVGTGNRLRYANFLNTLAFRPALNVPFRAGTKVGSTQEA